METSTIIQKKSLAEEVAGHLKEQITEGKLKKGEKLPIEPELMKIFGVGRSTIREAVRILENMGYLKVQQGRGTFIEIPTPAKEPLEQRLKRADIRELNEVRKILESAIAERAAHHHTKQDIIEMKKCLADRKNAAEVGLLNECIEADIKFHVSIAKATHNEILFELYSSVAARLQEGYKHIYDNTSCFLQSQSLHENLVESIIANDKQVAADLSSLFGDDLHI